MITENNQDDSTTEVINPVNIQDDAIIDVIDSFNI